MLTKKFFIPFACCYLLYVSSINAKAVNLQEALESAYNTNETFKKNQVEYINQIGMFSDAIASFLPNVFASINENYSENHTGSSSTNDTSSTQSLNITQNIFNSGGSISSLAQAKAAYRASRASYYLKEQSNFLDVISAYFTYSNALQKYEASISSLKFYEKSLESSKERFRLGDGSKTEVEMSQAALADAKYKVSRSLAELQSASSEFIRNTGLNVEPQDLEWPDIYDSQFDYSEEIFMQNIKQNNLEIIASQQTTKSQKFARLVATSRILPSANFTASLTHNSKPKANFLGMKNPDKIYRLGLEVNIPLLAFDKYSNIRKSKNDLRISALSQEETFKKVLSQSKSIWAAHQAIRDSYEAAKESVRATEFTLNATQKEYDLGLKTLTDLLQMEEKLYNIKLKKIEAETQYFLSYYKIQSLLGNLTVNSLKLNIKEPFNPDKEFKKAKFKIMSF